MGASEYTVLIDGMTWSYSRLKCFEDCRYKWFMKYILDMSEDPMFYASYGKLMHKLIEEQNRHIVSNDDMVYRFLKGFSTEVKGERPSGKIVSKYVTCGIEYCESCSPFKYKCVDVEKAINFNIDDEVFVGIVDYIGEDNGGLIIIDNKSRDLKPRSKGKKPTKSDKDLDEMLTQLYLYSEAVKQEYGEYPMTLAFNCFKENILITEPFNRERLVEAKEWALNTIKTIKECDEFDPSVEFFKCKYLCGLNKECCFWQER